MFIAAEFTTAKYWKQPKCPSANEWIKKLWYIYSMPFLKRTDYINTASIKSFSLYTMMQEKDKGGQLYDDNSK